MEKSHKFPIKKIHFKRMKIIYVYLNKKLKINIKFLIIKNIHEIKT